MSFEADALAELKKPRTKESTLAKKLALFLGSLAAFLLLGLLATSSSSKVGIVDLLGIVLILFVHESGHYLSMRWLGYRNVQMFFIPFFGAAVSGYSTPMPIFHQAFVILAGPIPGIFIGFLCLAFYLTSGNDMWQKMANWFILLNGLNLIPWYPLDGGRFVDYVVSNRHALSKTFFQLFVIGLGFYAYTKLNLSILIYLGIHTLFRIKRYYFVNRTAYELRVQRAKEGLSKSEDVPDEIATATIAKLTKALPLVGTGGVVAEYVRDIWIQANSERPSPFEVVIMGLTYLTAIALFCLYQFLYLPLIK